MSEILKAPQKEPPNKAEKAVSAKRAKDAAIEEAKKTIKEVTSKDDAVRLEAIQKLRNPPLESLDKAKELLKATPVGEISWLVASVDDVQSQEVAIFAAKLAEAGDLRDDPRWLLAKTVEFAYSARPDATVEARLDVNLAIAKVGGRLQDLMRDKAYDGVSETSFDEALYGGSMEGIPPTPESVFKEDKTEKESITDPELIRLFRKINQKIRVNNEYLNNPQAIEADIYELQKKAIENKVPESQISEAVERLKRIRSVAIKANTSPEQGPRYSEVSYEDMRGTLLPEDQSDHGFQKKFEFHYLTPAEVNQLKMGEEGQQEFFYEFVSKIYSMGRTPERAEIPDMTRYEEFTRFMTWLYPKNTDYHLGKYEYMWKEMPKHYQIVKNLLFTPGDIKDKLKNLQFMTPADMDHYIKNISHANYALSLYEDAVFDALSERQVKYKEALTYLKGKDSAVMKQYQELVRERKAGRLSTEKEKMFQDLQEKVDLVGYGVNLWDSDVQNYTEMDLEINEMSKELDRLTLKQGSGTEKLTPWEEDRMKTLKDEILYKQNVAQNAHKIEKGYGEELKKSQHDNRGLSPVDIEVKKRLRIVLQERFPDREIKEWELNRAVWAARQWMIGSSRLVSISSGMAIRPNAEFNNIIKEVSGGKYVMKAPAFEDIQRVINPELFQARFGVGSKMGDVYRAFLDKDLMETKGYVFRHDPKYQMKDEAGLDPIVRQSREFIRQVEDESGVPYSEMLTQGFFQGGGNFDKTGWRGEIATVDEIRKKYADMQARGEIDAGAKLDNQALGIQLLMKSGKENKSGRIEILTRLVKRNPLKLFHLLGEPMEGLYRKYNLTNGERSAFRRALSIAQIDTWDVTGQRGENKKRAFKDIDLLNDAGDFDNVLKPILKKVGLEGRSEELRSLLKDADTEFGHKVDKLASTDFPITLTMTDIDWKEASMFQTGTIAMDRRARDMGHMAAARDAWMAMQQPEFLANKDPKETLKKLKEFRDEMNAYTDPAASEKATYELARAWLKFNRNRRIHIENREGTPLGAVKGVFRAASEWVPLWDTIQKNLGEMDTSGGLLMRLAKLEVGKGDAKHRVLGEFGERWENQLEQLPHKLAEDVSYAVRFKGPHGNAFEEKQMDEILDQMLQMGIFNTEEHLYHALRKEMGAGLGNQVVGLIRKYWWLLPLLTAAYGAKEGLEEEKKR